MKKPAGCVPGGLLSFDQNVVAIRETFLRRVTALLPPQPLGMRCQALPASRSKPLRLSDVKLMFEQMRGR